MSQKCANPKCENTVVSIAGKRPKKYCSSRCTSAHWQKLHYIPKKEFIKVSISEWEALQATLAQKQHNLTKEENINAGGAENKPEVDNSAILEQIKYIEAEKVPSHRDTSNGRASWKFEQQKRINELKLKLK